MNKKELLFTSVFSVLAAGAILALVSCDMPWKKATSETSSENEITETLISDTSSASSTTEKERKSVTITYDFMTDTMESQTVTGYVNDPLELLTPVREGYDFLGWYTSSSYTKSYVDTVFPLTDKTLYAKWDAKTYTVTFDPFGNGLKTESLVRFGDVITYPSYTKDGYTLEGWYEGETLYGNEMTMPARNVSLTASWTLNTYHYTYELNGGVNDESNKTLYTVEMEGKSLLSPSREGYSFAGWYKDEALTQRVHDYPLEDNVTFYAKWSLNTYPLTLVTDHGAEGTRTENYAYGETVVLPILSETGYTFLGWYDGDSKVESFVMYGDTTLTARWELVTYTITYELDGGTLTSDAPTTYTVEDKEMPRTIIRNLVATKTGYTFVELDTNPELTRKFTALPGGDVILYAKYTINSYTIHYDVNGGDALVNEDALVVYNSVPAAVTPTRIYYTFDGWAWNDEKIDSSTFTMPAENITLKAIWNPVPYTVHYDYNYDYLVEDVSWGYDTSVSLLSPTRTGYTFVGWYDEDGNKQEDHFSMPAKAVSLTAHWTINSYTFTLDYGYEGKENDVKTLDYQTEITLTEPTRERYYFAGWYNGETKVEETTLLMPADNLTLTAHWTAIVYSYLTLDYGYDIDKTVTEYAEGTEVTLVSPTRDGYVFTGWYDGENKVEETSLTITSSDRTLTAHWALVLYTITYHYSSYSTADGTFTTSYDINEDDILIPSLSRDYCDFLGWYLDSSFTDAIENAEITWAIMKNTEVSLDSDGNPVGELDVYAHEETYFTVEDNAIKSVTEYAQNKFKGGTLVIPSEIDGKNITRVKFTEDYAFDVDTVTIEEGITTVESYGFENWRMKTVNLPSTLIKIGASGFRGCANLSYVNFTKGKDTLEISGSAFKDCTSLTSITLPENLTALNVSVFENTGLNGTFKIPENIINMYSGCLSGTKITELDLTACDKDIIAPGALSGMISLRILDVASDFLGFRSNLIDNSATAFETLNYEGTKQQFEAQLTACNFTSETYDFSARTSKEYVILCSDGSEIYYDKSALIPLKVYVRSSDTSDYTDCTSEGSSLAGWMNFSSGETTYTLTSLPSYNYATGSDDNYYYAWTGKYSSLVDSENQQVLVNDGKNFYESITLSPYPVELYGTAVSGSASYTITYNRSDEYTFYTTPVYYEYTYDYSTKSFLFGDSKATSYTLYDPKVTCYAYVFDGWYTSSDFAADTKVTKITASSFGGYPENIILYPKLECIYIVSDGSIAGINQYYWKSMFYDKDRDSTKVTMMSFDYNGTTISSVSGFTNNTKVGGSQTNIQTMIFDTGITAIQDNAFKNTTIKSFTLPLTLAEIGAYAFASGSITSITYQGTAAQFQNVKFNSGTSFDGCGTSCIQCSDQTVTI